MSYYRATDDSRHIAHWKYIRKYRGKNGKWRYVYKKAKKSIDNLLGADERYERNVAAQKLRALTKTDDVNVARLRAAAEMVNTWNPTNNYTLDKMITAKKKFEAAKTYEEKEDAYNRTVYGMMDKGKKFVSDLLNIRL